MKYCSWDRSGLDCLQGSHIAFVPFLHCLHDPRLKPIHVSLHLAPVDAAPSVRGRVSNCNGCSHPACLHKSVYPFRFVKQDQVKVCSLSREVTFKPLSPLLPEGFCFLHHPIPALPSACLAARFPLREKYGLTTFRMSATVDGLGSASAPVVHRLRWMNYQHPYLTTCRLAQACQPLWLVCCNGA